MKTSSSVCPGRPKVQRSCWEMWRERITRKSRRALMFIVFDQACHLWHFRICWKVLYDNTKKLSETMVWILPHHELPCWGWGAFGSNKCPVGSLSTKTGTPPAVGRGPKQSTEGAVFFLVVPLVDPRFFVELAARFSQILKTARYNSKGVDSPVVFFRRIVFYRFFVQRFETWFLESWLFSLAVFVLMMSWVASS